MDRQERVHARIEQRAHNPGLPRLPARLGFLFRPELHQDLQAGNRDSNTVHASPPRMPAVQWIQLTAVGPYPLRPLSFLGGSEA
jgi:hypothetical protein